MKEEIQHVPVQPGWKRLLQLFLICYLFLYLFPYPFDHLPVIRYLTDLYTNIMDAVIRWVGHRVFHLGSLQKSMGSGDTTFDFVGIAVIILLSILVSCVFFVLARNQNNYNRAYRLLIIYMRYYLGLHLIEYGLSKIFDGQFSYPGLASLEEKYGDSSPMTLLWTFMGYSKPYAVFTGILETIAGLLLFFRKTTTAGCLLSIIAMTNIVMLNLCYDVPVKLFCTHLLLISWIILWPDIKNLYNFFILHKPAALAIPALVLTKRWMQVTRVIVKGLIIIAVPTLTVIKEDLPSVNEPNAGRYASINGVYTPTLFVINKDTLRMADNTKRWNKMILEDDYVLITAGHDSTMYFNLSADTTAKKIQIEDGNDPGLTYSLSYTSLPGNQFIFSGKFQSDSIVAVFNRKQQKEYTLVKRGFHLISEQAYMR